MSVPRCYNASELLGKPHIVVNVHVTISTFITVKNQIFDVTRRFPFFPSSFLSTYVFFPRCLFFAMRVWLSLNTLKNSYRTDLVEVEPG